MKLAEQKQERRHSGSKRDGSSTRGDTWTSGTLLKQIQAYCDAVAREFHPEKIILFGSHAHGQPTMDSDVDLLVVMPFRGSDTTKAMQIRSRLDAPFPVDLLVRKPAFIAARLAERDMFIEWIMSQGKIMYESQHA